MLDKPQIDLDDFIVRCPTLPTAFLQPRAARTSFVISLSDGFDAVTRAVCYGSGFVVRCIERRRVHVIPKESIDIRGAFWIPTTSGCSDRHVHLLSAPGDLTILATVNDDVLWARQDAWLVVERVEGYKPVARRISPRKRALVKFGSLLSAREKIALFGNR